VAPLSLIRDASRDPDELLAEGIALSVSAIQLAASNSATTVSGKPS
jgi:hypothetical protein